MKSAQWKRGFSYIEVITVVSIIAVMAITSLYGFNHMQRRAAYTRAHKDINDIANAIYEAQLNSGKPLNEITQSNASELACRTTSFNPDTSDFSTPIGTSCYKAYADAIAHINQAAGKEVIHGVPLDPWGSPYMINENENTAHGFLCPNSNNDGYVCCTDNIGSAGPNRQLLLYGTANYDADDIIVNINPTCNPIEGGHHADQN